jgi:uncharacterized protein involved in type VI secretion and phage assembly
MTQFFGKYRGKVVQNFDPEQRGRILVSVPDVLGTGQGWAMPSVPYAGIQAGIYAVPPPQANVWVEFEGGNPDHPIWTGCFWGTGETPSLALAPPLPVPHILLQTTAQNVIHVSDALGAAGGILIKSTSGAMISVSDTGIIISDGKGGTVTLTGGVVSINPPALVIK